MKITKFGHSCLLIEEGDARLLIDPGAFSKGFEDLRELDALLITHQHADHVTPEMLAKVRESNPGVAVYADEGTVKLFSAQGEAQIKAVHAGEEFEVKGVKVAVYGSEHAIIHPAIPGIENIGYMLAERFFYPGDNFTIPAEPVEILALPLGAPWLKVSEVIDYVLKVKPSVAIPVHDAVLAMPAMHTGIVQRFTEPQGITLRVVENGEMIEVV
jgi:L-ascorbate metabolism protein UlaG (beta-lactamase superfamily)